MNVPNTVPELALIYDEVLHQTSDVFLVLEANSTKITFVNNAFSTIWKQDCQTLQAQDWAYFQQKFLDQNSPEIQQVITHKELKSLEIQICLDEKNYSCQLEVYPVQTQQQQYIVLIFRQKKSILSSESPATDFPSPSTKTVLNPKPILDLACGDGTILQDFVSLNKKGFEEFKMSYRTEMYSGQLEQLRKIVHKMKSTARFLQFQLLLDLMEYGKQLIVSEHKQPNDIESHLSEIDDLCDIALQELEALKV